MIGESSGGLSAVGWNEVESLSVGCFEEMGDPHVDDLENIR